MLELTVLGIDLACKSWKDNGSATLTFSSGAGGPWTGCQTGVIPWPAGDLCPAAMAEVIDDYAAGNDIAAVSLDGPQGWRDPQAW